MFEQVSRCFLKMFDLLTFETTKPTQTNLENSIPRSKSINSKQIHVIFWFPEHFFFSLPSNFIFFNRLLPLLGASLGILWGFWWVLFINLYQICDSPEGPPMGAGQICKKLNFQVLRQVPGTVFCKDFNGLIESRSIWAHSQIFGFFNLRDNQHTVSNMSNAMAMLKETMCFTGLI